MNKIPSKFLTKTTLLNHKPKKNKAKKIKKGEDLFACILCICMSSLVKGLDIEKYIRINKIPNIEISTTKRKIFEENYQHALQMEKEYSQSAKEAKDFRFYLPNLSDLYNKTFTAENLTVKLFENIILNVLTLSPIYPVMGIFYTVKAIKDEVVKDDTKMSNILSLVAYVCNEGSNLLNLTKQYRNNQITLGSLILPFFSVRNVVNIAKSVASSISSDAISEGDKARDAVDRDLAHIGKTAVEAKAHKAFMDFIVLPELNLVKKYPFLKPILFAQPGNILEIGSQVRQLYKEHYETEFSTLLKKNTALICGYEPNRPSTGAENSLLIDDYVI